MTATRTRASTSIYVDPDRLARLRELAAAAGLTQERGVGANTIGSFARLVDVLADGYAAEPEAVIAFVRALVTTVDQHA